VPILSPTNNLNFLQSLEKSFNCIKDPQEKSEEIFVDRVMDKAKDHDKTCQPSELEVKDVENAANNVSKPSHFNPEVESISVIEDKMSDESEMSKANNNATDESFINVEEEEEDDMGETLKADQCDKISEDINSIQNISVRLEGHKNSRSRNRFSSLDTDCSGLQILSEIANSREKIIAATMRIERSKSLDSKISRTSVSKHDDNEIIQEEVCSDQMKSIFELDCEQSTKVGHLDETSPSVEIKKKLIKKKKLKRLKKKNKEGKLHKDFETVKKEIDLIPASDEADSDPDVKNVNILTSFKETFQKFKLKHLSRSIVDTKTSTISKKIPTLENWTTIMKEKRLVKKDPEMPVLTPIIPDEKLLNNNTKRDLDVGSSSYLNTSKEPCCGSINEDCHTDEKDVGENNNDIENAQEDAVIDEFVCLKKKVKLKKKYKASIHEFENAIGKDDALSKKKKKKKKDKKEKKEKDRFSFDKIMKDKEKKLKEKKDRKKEKIKKPKKEKNSPKETFINPSDDESTFPKTSPSIDVSMTQKDFGDILPSCELTSDDLRDGLRVLLRLGGHFHTSRVTEISPPDIYGVVVDKERGNKPHILSRGSSPASGSGCKTKRSF